MGEKEAYMGELEAALASKAEDTKKFKQVENPFT
jgi:hypothetical protein